MTKKSMRVAVLDDYNGLAADALSGIQADVTIFRDTILPSQDIQGLIKRLEPYDVLCTMRERTPFPRDLIDALPNLKVILTTGMRNLGIDVAHCKAKGIIVAGTPRARDAPTAVPIPPDFNATVQHTWALILGITNNLVRDHSLIPAGTWTNALPLNTFIGGKTIGLLGLGKLGAGTARIAHLAYGMQVIAWSENLTQAKADAQAASAGLPAGTYKAVSREELFALSDILSIQLVLSDRTRGLVGRQDLKRMKPTSFLINTSRGPIVQEDALLEVLESGCIRGAAIDVFDLEPLPVDARWRTVPWGEGGRSEVLMTPHTGYSFEDTLTEMWEHTAENLARVIKGESALWVLE